jgi:hypothetical protein
MIRLWVRSTSDLKDHSQSVAICKEIVAILCRPLRCQDVASCVEIVARHPFVGPRYAGALPELRTVWTSLLDRDAFRAYVYEDAQESPSRLVGVGCSAIITDEFLHEAKTPPFFWIGAELTRRVSRGDSPLLSDKDVRDRNSHGGLCLAVWEGATDVRDMNRVDVLNAFLGTFIELHRGLQLKEIVGQGSTPDTLAAVTRAGYLFVSRSDGRYTETNDAPPDELIFEPHVLGLTRELAPGRAGTWASRLFVFEAARFGFRPGEQRQLLAALRGGTDEDIAGQLGISRSAVKKRWHSIYGRVSSRAPDLIPGAAEDAETRSERGKAKKQRLIAYLRDHPEELRPARDN